MPPCTPVSSDEPEQWRRLDVRTLITWPVTAFWTSTLVTAASLIGISSAVAYHIAIPVTLLGLVVAAALPWARTSYRVMPTQLEVRCGVLNRSTVTARLDWRRTVDLEANLVHRLVGVTTVVVGTGAEESELTLDAVTVAEPQRLRVALLHGADASAAKAIEVPVAASQAAEAPAATPAVSAPGLVARPRPR